MAPLQYNILSGPTGVGKSELAVKIAERLKAEIVSADAFQIYEGLDILTGKPSPEQLKRVKHHLVSTLPLTESCDAHRFAGLARNIVHTLNDQNVIPLISGGTGFYIEAFSGNLPELPAPDLTFRSELEQLSMSELLTKLLQYDSAAWERIDRQNRRRVTRALEVCLLSGKPFSSFQTISSSSQRYWLERPRDELYQRINQRVDRMFEEGVVAEVASVAAISMTASQAIGYGLIRSYLKGALSLDECRERIKRATRNYAKRQMTWFRNHGYQAIFPLTAIDQIVAEMKQKAN